MNKLLLPALLAGSLAAAPALSAMLHTSGEAKLMVAADQVQLDLHAASLSKTASDAKQQVDKIVTVTQSNLANLLSESDRFEASQLQIQAEYKYQDRERIFVGYRAQRSIIVELADSDKLTQVLDAAMLSGVNEVRQLQYKSSQEEQYKQQVRAMAVADSYAKARQLASAYNGQLGPVVEINYRNQSAVPMMKIERVNMAAADTGGSSYQAAQLTYHDSVDVSFELLTEE
ncbi:SIMPL domain-containing protein [Agarivorans sp. MS3-6]|uniref:SIMPL domain-containing protein n=1 Tax=Agarivorans sp. TSD2052 TaxID=2937286 RepID=UPI00200F0963|nr:SIMPL domain-containing protein [Agarivorans sp. TSD2052]UPW19323.1 SIMPL domain-containing protein [Agarivorans sp. TSD2052]